MKRSQQKVQTRNHLLKVAAEVFAEEGFFATKTLDIALAAGVSHGTLFSHFPTREDLLIKVTEEFGLQLGTKFEELTTDQMSTKDILAAHLAMIEEYEPFYTCLVTESFSLPAPVRHRIFMIQSGIAHHLEKSLKDQTDMPSLPFILNSWLGLIHYYLVNRDFFAPGRSVIATHGQKLLNQFIQTFQL
jgi:AcrR family transcriptional regulator